jgi:hypothetical protein
MFSGFFAIELFQLIVYATVTDVQFWTWDFVLTLVFQELLSFVHNVGAIRLLLHQMWKILGRETVLEHPFGSRRAMKNIIHWAFMDSVAEFTGIVTVCSVVGFESILNYTVDGATSITCTLSRCRPKIVDSQLLWLYFLVFIVRMLVVFLERVVLLRMIRYYGDISSEPQLALDYNRFRFGVCKLLDGNSYVLILAVFVSVMAYASSIHNGF